MPYVKTYPSESAVFLIKTASAGENAKNRAFSQSLVNQVFIFIPLSDSLHPVLRYGLFRGAIWALSGDDKAHIRVRNGAFRSVKSTILCRHGF